MGRRKLGEQNVRKLTKVGQTSLSVTIPVEAIRKLSWREKQKVTVTPKGEKLIVEDWKKKP